MIKNTLYVYMIQLDKKEREGSLKKVIDFLKKKGYTNFKADCTGYDTPRSFNHADKDLTIIPDVVAEKGGKKHFFDVGIKSEKPRLLKTKWLILSSWATARSAKFKILVPRGHFRFASDAIEEIGLKPNVMMKMSSI